MLLADYALQVTIVAVVLWVILFPLLVQGLIVYAVMIGRGERRQNEEYRRRRQD
jgi:hypothetical protein